jgi:hypothetical protein
MAPAEKLRRLARDKELLLRQAGLHRALLRLEAHELGEALRWTGTVRGAWRAVKPWAGLAAPVAGVALALRGPRLLRAAAKAARFLPVAAGLWRAFKGVRGR